MSAKDEYERVQEIIKNEPLPEVNEEWEIPSEKLNKKIIVKVLAYKEGFGDILTIHSGRVNQKTEHWIRKKYFYSRNR